MLRSVQYDNKLACIKSVLCHLVQWNGVPEAVVDDSDVKSGFFSKSGCPLV